MGKDNDRKTVLSAVSIRLAGNHRALAGRQRAQEAALTKHEAKLEVIQQKNMHRLLGLFEFNPAEGIFEKDFSGTAEGTKTHEELLLKAGLHIGDEGVAVANEKMLLSPKHYLDLCDKDGWRYDCAKNLPPELQESWAQRKRNWPPVPAVQF